MSVFMLPKNKKEAPKKKQSASFKWLDRHLAAPGPFITLVTTEEAFKAAQKHIKADLKSEWITENRDGTCHWLTRGEELMCIVAIRLHIDTGRSLLQHYAMLVHEAVHAIDKYFDSFSETYPATEQKAYAIQIMSQNLMYEYDRQVEQRTKGKK